MEKYPTFSRSHKVTGRKHYAVLLLSTLFSEGESEFCKFSESDFPGDSMFSTLEEEGLDPSVPDETEQRRMALQNILDAWDEALAEGVSADILATTAIFAALSDMVEAYGEEAVAEMAAGLADRVRQGEFTLNRVMN